MDNRTQVRSKFAAALRNFDTWACARAGKKRYNPLEPWIREYEHWDKFSAAFVDFLRNRPIEEWNQRDINLAHDAALIDWGHHRLLRPVPEGELPAIMFLLYPDDAVRMYMQMHTRFIGDTTLREFVLMHFLDDDPSESIQDSAFESLSAMNSDKTAEYAEKLWSTGNELRRLVVLKSLQNTKSPLLEKYSQLAKSAGIEA
jgi:hypothetical protein